MISLHQFVYGLGLLFIVIVCYFLLIELAKFNNKRHEDKIKRWGEEIIRQDKNL